MLTLEKLCKLIDCTKRYYRIYLKATGVSVGSVSFSRGERSNAARTQSAAVLPSLAPHGVRRGCDW